MTGKTWNHIFALVATLLAAFASGLQARRALEKAEQEGGPHKGSTSGESPNSKTQRFKEGIRPSARALRDAVFSHNTPHTDGFNVRHFRHVAVLWILIMIGSALAVVAEIIGFYVEPK